MTLDGNTLGPILSTSETQESTVTVQKILRSLVRLTDQIVLMSNPVSLQKLEIRQTLKYDCSTDGGFTWGLL